MLSLGKETTVQALGQEWTVSRLEIRLIREFRDWIKARVGNPFAFLDAAYFDRLPQDEQVRRIKEAESVADQLKCFTLQCELAQRFMATEEGAAKLAQLLLRQHHPNVTEDQAFTVFMECADRFKKAMADAAGETPQGNPPLAA